MSERPTPAERALFGERVRCERPASVAALGEIVRAAGAEGATVLPAGSGTHPEAGDPPRNPAFLATAEHFDRIVQYEPDDFTIGVGAGMRCDELRAELVRHRQELGHDFPHGAGTIGGLVARAPYSLRQGSVGPLHSLVLGVEGVCGTGRPFRSGGMVVKNVAGYQIHKICVGASGTLGMLTRINFRLRPLPERRVVAVAACATAELAATFAQALRSRGLEPAALVALFDAEAPLPGPATSIRVAWVFEGPAARVKWLEAEAGKVAASTAIAVEAHRDADAGAWLDALAAFEEPAEDRAGGIVRVATSPTLAFPLGAELARDRRLRVLADLASGAVLSRWNGTTGTDAALDVVRAATARHGGTARIIHLRAEDRRRFPRDLTPDPNAALASRIRHAFDPQGVFARDTPAPAAFASSAAR